MNAIADFLAAAETCLHDREPGPGGVGSPDVIVQMRSALVRLEMSGRDAGQLIEVLRDWPYKLYLLELRVGPTKKLDSERQKAAWPVLRSCVVALLTYAPSWTSARKAARAEIISSLSQHSRAMSAYLAAKKEEEDEATEVAATESG